MHALGHRTETASSGPAGLERLFGQKFDVVLLDIVMPGMDGYDVLRRIKAEEALRHVPVIVISSLDDEAESVAKAIELGAEDFLPKDFKVSILRARLDASLARKRFRDRELAYFRDVDRLTEAAEVIEAGAFRPADVNVESVAARADGLGRLAHVFQRLAEEVYEREKRLDIKVRTLRGILLVLAAGASFGLTPALGRMAVGLGAPPLGLVFWANVVSAVCCFAIVAARGRLPEFRLEHLRFLLVWAVVLGVVHRLATFVIAQHVEASTISLVASSRGFMVFGLAAMMALEPPSLRRLAGLSLGFVAVAAVMLSSGSSPGETIDFWLIAALILPFLMAIHSLLMTWRPPELESIFCVGAMMTLSAVIIGPIAAASGDLSMPQPAFSAFGLIVLVIGIASAASLVLALDLVALAGAVFASQTAYSQTAAGVLWAMLLLGEGLSQLGWLALALIIIGIWLVEPKRAGDEFAAQLRFGNRPSRIDA